MIDFWFKLAVGLLSLVVRAVAAVVGFFLPKTLDEARSVAVTAARDEATTSAAKLIANNNELVLNATAKAFSEGAFAQAILTSGSGAPLKRATYTRPSLSRGTVVSLTS